MGLITASKIILAIIMPLLILLLAADFVAFSDSFYQEKFLEYGVQKKVPGAAAMHQRVMEFLKGKSNELPPEFNSREMQHMLDVRKIVNISAILLYILLALFAILAASCAFILKSKKEMAKLIGNALLFGGILAMIIAAAFLLFINSDFSASFESFHSMLFPKGTYTFDPAKEIIVRIYPEQLFMDLGIRILEYAAIGSAAAVLLGALILLLGKRRFKYRFNKNI